MTSKFTTEIDSQIDSIQRSNRSLKCYKGSLANAVRIRP